MTAERASAGARVVALAVAVVVAAATAGVGIEMLPEEPAAAALSLSVSGRELSVTHRGGPALDVREIRLRVSVDGTPLAHQPPVPFFAAAGFRGGPTGPFNPATDPRWTPGERAGLRIASTNRPVPGAGSRVTVRLYAGDRLVASATAQA